MEKGPVFFKDKAVVVTGAGRGIGRALALGFAEQGARVLVHYAHAQEEAEAVASQITESGGSALLLQADLAQPEASAFLVSEASRLLGPIDVWMNNAGASANSRETVGMSELEIYERMMQVDVRATWLCLRALQAHMRDQGCILTVGWDGALAGARGVPAQLYALSKGAVISLTRCLALEYAPRLRVNCIAPGFIENDWSRSLSESAQQRFREPIPLQRLGNAEDIVGTALFLASSAAAYITGQVILVNGGEVMR